MGVALGELVRTLVVLAFVVGGVVALGRLTQRWQRGQASRSPVGHIDVAARRALGKNSALLVVRVGGRTFLVSQTTQQLNLLSELDDEQWRDDASSENPSARSRLNKFGPRMASGSAHEVPTAWDAFIEHVREKTVRR